MNYRVLLPNICTSMNLVFGVCSILSSLSGNLIWGSIFILLALVADGMDGRTARFFGVASEMGKEMDSLCDLGSFGIAPGILAWQFVLHDYGYLVDIRRGFKRINGVLEYRASVSEGQELFRGLSTYSATGSSG